MLEWIRTWSPEAWVAIYAALVSTLVAFVQIRQWLKPGVRLDMEVASDMAIVGANRATNESKLTVVTVFNRGTQPTAILGLAVGHMPTWWRRRLKMPAQSFVAVNPHFLGHPSNVPGELAPNKRWQGVIRRRDDLMPDPWSGQYYAIVQGSHRDKPYMKRIPKVTQEESNDG
ncbi:MAG: hypothetical protein A49_22700 [Methyloceanibacter sp.]|nr:MAG: hypothetical protein A49_22700 [Methyloceanibacter sp.]